VWQIWLFMLNGFVFFLLGLQLPTVLRDVVLDGTTLASAVAIVLVVVFGRFLWVFPVVYIQRLIFPLFRRADPTPPWRAVTVIGWAGLRGVVSLAAALALPNGFPGRPLILFFTFTVILVTLVGQGLTLPAIIRALGLAPDADKAGAETHARALTAEAALARLDDLEAEWPTHKPLIDALRAKYEHATSHAEERAGAEPGAAEQEQLEHTQIRRELIEAERRAAFDLRERGVIDDQLLRRIERDLDLEELRSEG
jgi:CPA1 family monovalent cation:H+ antiporter